MRLLEKSGTLQILDTLRESNVKEDVSDLINNEDDVLLGSEEFDGTDLDGVDVSGREPIASFYTGRGNADPGIEIYEIESGAEDRILARDLAKLDEKEQAHWYNIEYEFEDEEGNEYEEARAYADVDGIKVYIDECIRTNLNEAEQTVDVFVNPERDYKITDVTMLEPVDDGDVRAIDMQSILIGLDESLSEKYGENWGEFNIQSSRTPRGKITEDDISYVLHVLDINGHQNILNYNTKGTGRIREASITDYKGRVLESKRCAISRIPKFFMEATEEYIKKYNEEPLTEDAVLPNNGYIDQTGLNLVSDERIQASLKRRVQRLKARQKLLKSKQTFDKKGNVTSVDEKNTHGKEVVDSEIGQETKPITDTKIKESVITLDTDTGTVDLDGNVSHVTVDQDGTMTAVSDGEVITATDNSVEVLPSEETMIADDTVLEPAGDEITPDNENILDDEELVPEEPEIAPEEAPEGEAVETGDIAMAEPVPASELEESVDEEVEDTELWCRGKIYWTGNYKDIDENLLLDVADQAAEEEGEEVDVDEVDIKKLEESLKESSEDIDKFWAKGFKVGDKVMSSGAGEVEILDLDKGKDYILVNRNTSYQPYVAAWAPQLDDEGKLFWGQGHYFNTEEEARNYMEGLKESLKESERFTEEERKAAKELFGVDADDFVEKIYATNNPEEMLNYLESLPDTDFKKECLDSFDYYEDHDDIKFENGDYKDLIADALDTMIQKPNFWKDKVVSGNNGKRFTEAVEEKVESEIEGDDVLTKEETIEEDLVPSAIFHRKPSNVETMRKEEENNVVTAKSTYVVKDVKEVDETEYEDLCNNLQRDRDYIKEFADSVETDNSVTFNCLEVKGPNGSLLIDPSGYGYARYCAFGNEVVEEPVEVEETEEVIEEPVEGE